MPELDRLIWIDLETTGLVAEHELILEVGMVITDLDLNRIDDHQELIWSSPEYNKAWEIKTHFVKDMHDKSGLISAIENNGSLTPDNAMKEFADWLEGHGVRHETEEPMCGSSVQFDRLFLQWHWPEIFNRFSYRNIDISTIKELCKRFNPAVYSKLQETVIPAKRHRVLPDLQDTIEEFRFYRDSFLFDARAR